MRLSEAESAELKRLSRTVFGQELRVPVMIAILRMKSDRFTLTDLQTSLDLRHASALQAPLSALVEGGFVIKEAPEANDRYRYYKRLDSSSSMWTLAEELLRRVREGATAADASVTRLRRKQQ
jgi:predicted transcriptional regulator